MSERTPSEEIQDSILPDPSHPRSRYRGAFRISLAVSALIHILAIALYPSFFSGIPEAQRVFGGSTSPGPSGTELVNLTEVPPEEAETPRPPEEQPDVEVPPAGVTSPSFGEEVAPGPELPGPPDLGPTAAERLRPKAEDLRYWAPVDPERTALTREEIMRLRFVAELEAVNDSAAAAAEAARKAMDWTYTDEEGKRWGISPGKLHLGDLTLPLPAFGMSPGQRERGEDRLWAWDEIQRGAESGQLLRSWKDRDQAIRERMNAERKPDTTGTGGGGG